MSKTPEERLAAVRDDAVRYLKSGISTQNTAFNRMIAEIEQVYSTLGEISMKLDEYTPNQFSYDFFPQGERKRDYSSICVPLGMV